MKRLRIVFLRKGEDLMLVDMLVPALENLSDGEIFQIALGHASSPRARCSGLPNHEPPATAAALMRPKAQSATAKAANTRVRLPLKRQARLPPAAAIRSRVKLASSGHSSRPAPCEAK